MKKSVDQRPVLLSVKQVAAQTSFSTSHIYKLVDKGTFPQTRFGGFLITCEWRAVNNPQYQFP